MMAYNKKKLYEQAMDVIQEYHFFYISDICDQLGISRETFYKYFPIDSDDMDNIKKNLQKNKLRVKNTIRKDWATSDDFRKQIAIYKIVGNQDERDALNNRIDQNNEVSITNVNEHFKNIADAIAKSDTDTDTTI